MKKLVGNTIISLAIILCLIWKRGALQALSTCKVAEMSSGNENSQLTACQEPRTARPKRMETTGVQELGREFLTERDSRVLKNENVVKERETSFDGVNEIFNPFFTFPFFPFHASEPKRSALKVNSSKKELRFEKDSHVVPSRPPRKPKPFLFIDFAFNIQEIPMRNKTREQISSSEDSLLAIYPKKSYQKREGKGFRDRKGSEVVPFDFIDEDWSFFDDLSLLSRGVDEFRGPQSKLRFFDLPFLGKRTPKQTQSKRDKPKVAAKSEVNTLMGIFDRAISRMKREMEKTKPLWDFLVGTQKIVRSEERKGRVPENVQRLTEETLTPKDPENKWKENAQTNVSQLFPEETGFRKSPVTAEKAVEMEEFHIRDDHPKLKKKRRNTWILRKKEKQGLHENSAKLRRAGEPNDAKFSDFDSAPTSARDVFRKIREENTSEEKSQSGRKVRASQDAKILDLMGEWDRREMEEEAEKTGKTTESDAFESCKKKEGDGENGSDGTGALIPKDKSFKYVGQNIGKKEVSINSAGLEVLKPQQSSSRRKRKENDGGGIWQNITSSKDEVRRNITHVLGQFFSMIKKLGESKNLHQDKQNQEIVDVIWPELEQVPYAKVVAERMREERDAEKDGKDSPAPVADLNFLLLTVTLPTALSFTLLFVICFISLRPSSWLCEKLFQSRNLYVVEEDAEKGKKAGGKPMVEKEVRLRKEILKEEEEMEVKADNREYKKADTEEGDEETNKITTRVTTKMRNVKTKTTAFPRKTED